MVVIRSPRPQLVPFKLHRFGQQRLVKHFLSRCDEFVAATTYGLFGEPESPRIAPKELMVYFYVRQNRIVDAVRFAEVMVNCVREDTRTLPLERPRWAAKLDVTRTMGK
jgi:hypothetical protein